VSSQFSGAGPGGAEIVLVFKRAGSSYEPYWIASLTASEIFSSSVAIPLSAIDRC